MWLSAKKELNFKFNLILLNLNLNSHMWLVATLLGSASLYNSAKKLSEV